VGESPISDSDLANFVHLSEEFVDLAAPRFELARVLQISVAQEQARQTAKAARAKSKRTFHTSRGISGLPPGPLEPPKARETGPGIDAWTRAGRAVRPLVSDLAAAKRDAEMIDLLDGLLRLWQAEAERQVERDRENAAREQRGEDRERWMTRLAAMAVLLAIPAAGPVMTGWIGALAQAL
jgi:hypothetical protein